MADEEITLNVGFNVDADSLQSQAKLAMEKVEKIVSKSSGKKSAIDPQRVNELSGQIVELESALYKLENVSRTINNTLGTTSSQLRAEDEAKLQVIKVTEAELLKEKMSIQGQLGAASRAVNLAEKQGKATSLLEAKVHKLRQALADVTQQWKDASAEATRMQYQLQNANYVDAPTTRDEAWDVVERTADRIVELQNSIAETKSMLANLGYDVTMPDFSLNGAPDVVTDLYDRLLELEGEYANVVQQNEMWTNALLDEEKAENEVKARLAIITQSLREEGESLGSLGEAGKKAGDGLRNTSEGEQDVDRNSTRMKKSTTSAGQSMATTFSNVAHIIGNLLPSSFGRVVSSISIMCRALNDLDRAFEDVKESENEASDATEEVSEKSSNTANSILKSGSIIMAAVAAVVGTVKTIVVDTFKSGQTLLNNILKTCKKFATFIKSTFVKAIKSASGVIKKLSGTLSKLFSPKSAMSWKKGLGMILKYVIGVRSLYFLVRKIRTAIKEGFDEIVKFSDRTNKALSNLTSAWNQLKGQISASLEPILVTFEPLVTSILNRITEATLALTKFIGALTGQKQVLKATQIYKDYAESVENASKQLQGFDELNNLSESGSGDGDDNTVGWEWVDSEFPSWWEQLKKSWEEADFTELGDILAEKFDGMLDKINWSKITSLANKIGSSFATLLNGFMSSDYESSPFVKFGTAVASTLDVLGTALSGFLSKFNFNDLGKSIGFMLESFVSGINWDIVVSNVTVGLNGILDVLKGFFLAVDVTDVSIIGDTLGEKFKEVFASISWTDLGEVISTGILEALTFVSSFIQSADLSNILSSVLQSLAAIDWASLGKSVANILNTIIDESKELLDSLITKDGYENSPIYQIYTFLANAIDTIDWDKLLSTIIQGAYQMSVKLIQALSKLLGKLIKKIDFAELGETLGGALSGIFSNIVDFIDGNQADIVFAIEEFLNGLDLQNLASWIVTIIKKVFKIVNDSGIAKEIYEFVSTIGATILVEIGKMKVSAVILAIDDKLSTIRDAMLKPFKKVGKLIIDGIVNGISAGIQDIKDAFSELATKVIDFFKELFGIHSPSKVFEEFGEFLIEGFILGITNMLEDVKEIFTNLKTIISTKWDEITDDVSTKFSGMYDIIVEKIGEWKSSISETVSDIKSNMSEKWSDIKSNVVDVFSTMKTDTGTKLSDWKSSISTKLSVIKTTFTQSFTNIKTKVVEIFEGMCEALKSPINVIIGFINSMISGVVTGINTILGALSQIQVDVPAAVEKITGISSFGFGDIQLLTAPEIPLLAQGAVIPPNREFLAVLGDQRHGTNIETPLSTMIDAFNTSLAQNGGVGNAELIDLMQEQIQLLQTIADKEFGITDRQIFKSVRASANSYKKSTGNPAFI